MAHIFVRRRGVPAHEGNDEYQSARCKGLYCENIPAPSFHGIGDVELVCPPAPATSLEQAICYHSARYGAVVMPLKFIQTVLASICQEREMRLRYHHEAA